MGIPFYPPRLKITKPSVVYGKDYAVLADLDVQPLFENRWNHRLPHGEVTMMLGHGGIGKSLLTCQLAAWMTRGTPLPEEESRRPPGYVCAVTLEDSLAVWKDRFIAAGGDPSRLVVKTETSHFDLSTLHGHEGEWDLITIDPAISLLTLMNISLSDTRKIREVLEDLRRIARRLRTPILLTHHLNSRGNAYGGDAWRITVRSELLLGEQQDKTLGLYHKKVNYGPLQPPVQFKKIIRPDNSFGLEYLGINENLEVYEPPRPRRGADDGSSKHIEQALWIEDILKEHRGVLPRENLEDLWIERWKMTVKTLQRALSHAEQKGRIQRRRKGRAQEVVLKAIADLDNSIPDDL